MKIKEITYSLSRKIQVERFEPMEFFFSATAELSPKDDIMEAWDTLAEYVNQRIGAEQLKWKDTQKAARALSKQGENELRRQRDTIKAKF